MRRSASSSSPAIHSEYCFYYLLFSLQLRSHSTGSTHKNVYAREQKYNEPYLAPSLLYKKTMRCHFLGRARNDETRLNQCLQEDCNYMQFYNVERWLIMHPPISSQCSLVVVVVVVEEIWKRLHFWRFYKFLYIIFTLHSSFTMANLHRTALRTWKFTEPRAQHCWVNWDTLS